MFINKWMEYYAALKKEETLVTCWVKFKDKGQILYDSTHIKYPK